MRYFLIVWNTISVLNTKEMKIMRDKMMKKKEKEKTMKNKKIKIRKRRKINQNQNRKQTERKEILLLLKNLNVSNNELFDVFMLEIEKIGYIEIVSR